MTTETYRDIIRDYYHAKENEDYRFAASGMIVIIDLYETECYIYENAQQCFEQSVKLDIEESYSEDDPFDFSIFTSKQLDFMAKTYPDTNLAAQIAKFNKNPDLTVTLSGYKFDMYDAFIYAVACCEGESFPVRYILSNGATERAYFRKHIPQKLKRFENDLWESCNLAFAPVFDPLIKPIIEEYVKNLNDVLTEVTA